MIGLLLLALILAALRASLLYARMPILSRMEEEGKRGAGNTLRLLERPHLRVSVRVSVVITHFLLAGTLLGMGMPYFSSDHTLPIWLVLLVMLAVSLLILGLEFRVESIIMKNTESWAIRLAPLGYLIDFILRPVTWFLVSVLRIPVVSQNMIESTVIEDELKEWVKESTPNGELEQDERRMIYSIFQFGDTLCREIMVPRIDIFALEADTNLTEAIQEITRTGHSRVPVYEDNIDNIIGVLYVKDLLRVNREQLDELKIGSYLRQAYFVPEAKKVSELLREMRAREVHMVIVVDEYGGTAGLVTLEDIVEEIVGEIRDEYDQAEELLYQQLEEDVFIFQGRIGLDDLNELLDTHLELEDADTLAGYLYGELGRVPAQGEQVEVEGWVMTIAEVRGRRIQKVRVERQKKVLEEDDKKNDHIEPG